MRREGFGSWSTTRPMAPTRFWFWRRLGVRGPVGIHRSRRVTRAREHCLQCRHGGPSATHVETLEGRVGGIREAFLEEGAP